MIWEASLATTFEPAMSDLTTASSTADTWQRARDKARVERRLGLPERPPATPPATPLAEPAEPPTSSTTFEFRDKSGLVIARGYTRVLYGDHGAYIELERAHRATPHHGPASGKCGFERLNRLWANVERNSVFGDFTHGEEGVHPRQG